MIVPLNALDGPESLMHIRKRGAVSEGTKSVRCVERSRFVTDINAFHVLDAHTPVVHVHECAGDAMLRLSVFASGRPVTSLLTH